MNFQIDFNVFNPKKPGERMRNTTYLFFLFLLTAIQNFFFLLNRVEQSYRDEVFLNRPSDGNVNIYGQFSFLTKF